LDLSDVGELKMGGSIKEKEVTLRISEDPAGSGRFKVEAKASYGSGV